MGIPQTEFGNENNAAGEQAGYFPLQASNEACHAASLMLRYDPDDPGELSGALHGG